MKLGFEIRETAGKLTFTLDVVLLLDVDQICVLALRFGGLQGVHGLFVDLIADVERQRLVVLHGLPPLALGLEVQIDNRPAFAQGFLQRELPEHVLGFTKILVLESQLQSFVFRHLARGGLLDSVVLNVVDGVKLLIFMALALYSVSSLWLLERFEVVGGDWSDELSSVLNEDLNDLREPRLRSYHERGLALCCLGYYVQISVLFHQELDGLLVVDVAEVVYESVSVLISLIKYLGSLAWAHTVFLELANNLPENRDRKLSAHCVKHLKAH